MGKIFAFMTGEYVTEESAEFGDFERSGWVDPRWSRTEFFDSRNDVTPVFAEWEQHTDLPDVLAREDFDDAVREVIADLGAVTDNGDGTFYALNGVDDYVNGGTYTYAIHFMVKRLTAAGYVELPWHPSDAGVDVSDLCY